ncbi:MAG: hypothetical protein N2749_04750 [Clostridia bacterium]|nr:hypothetical protein [Clostridia bacterium]
MSQIIKRLGKGGNDNSSGKSSCPDILEIDTGDFIIIGTDVTEKMKNSLPQDASCADYEKIVLIPRKLLLSAKEDIPNC